jgi:hypothetical protein
MLPLWFAPFVEFFGVPVGVLVLAYGINDQFRLKYSSGSDFFVFFVSLDLNALLFYDVYQTRINPAFSTEYLPVFVLLTVVCLILLVVTLRLQGKIDEWKAGISPVRSYPIGKVIACWFATAWLISTHLYIFFGGS